MASTDSPVLEDLLAPGLKVVFCGTAAGTLSAAQGAYYAHPQNRFWPTLHRLGLTPVQLEPDQFRSLLDHGIGLTDASKTGVGSDTAIAKDQWDTAGLEARIAAHAPALVAFNGLNAARVALGDRTAAAGPYPKRFGGAEVWVLPSTSPSANRSWKPEIWEAFADRLRSLDQPAELAEPAEPAEPAELAEPSEPSEPTEPTKPAHTSESAPPAPGSVPRGRSSRPALLIAAAASAVAVIGLRARRRRG